MKNMYEWAKEIRESAKRIAIPIMTHPGIEMCGYTVKEAVTDGQIHYEAIKKLNDFYPSAASTIIMDLTVEAEAFGANISFSDDEMPSIIGELVSDFDSVDRLNIPDLKQGRAQEYILANKLTAENINDKPVFGGCIGPYSLAGRLFGMTEMMTAIYTDPQTITLLLEKCTRYLEEYCSAIKSTGVNGIIIAEPAAGLISNEDCSEFSSQYVKRIVESLQDESFFIILHNCGNTGHCTPAMVETKAWGLHFGNKIDMLDALKECPSDILVMGNIDPVNDFKMTTPANLRKVTTQLLEMTSAYPNYVLSTGCDVPPHVPKENIETFFDALETYNISRL